MTLHRHLARLGTTLCAGLFMVLGHVAAAQAEDWKFTTSAGYVSFTAEAQRGTGSVDGVCNAKLGKSVSFALYDYKGNALHRVNDRSETVFFDIHMKNGELHVFEGVMHYVEGEKAWVTNVHLKPDFLDAFAKGYKLSLRGSKSTEDTDYPWVADFGLSGSAKVRRAVYEFCGF
jgi:hypothetical protein